jgi:hypothetical protein
MLVMKDLTFAFQRALRVCFRLSVLQVASCTGVLAAFQRINRQFLQANELRSYWRVRLDWDRKSFC